MRLINYICSYTVRDEGRTIKIFHLVVKAKSIDEAFAKVRALFSKEGVGSEQMLVTPKKEVKILS